MSEAPTTFGELIQAGAISITDGYRAKNSELGGDGLIFLRAGHVTDAHIDFAGVERFHNQLTPKLQDKTSRVHDVIVTTKGNSTGRTSFVDATMPTFVYSPHLSRWRVEDRTRISPAFLRYWSRSPQFVNQMRGLAASTDMAPYLSLRDQQRLEITLPHIGIQREIGAVLSSLDDKIEQNRRTGRALEGTARATFKAWFVDFEPVKAKAAGQTSFPGMPPATFAALPDRVTDSTLGAVPQGWSFTDFGSEFDFQVGFAFKSVEFTDAPDAVRLVRGDNVKEGRIEWGTKTRRWNGLNEKVTRYNLAVGDVVIGMDGSKLGKNWARVREFDLPSLLVQRVARFRSVGDAGPSLLWLLISHPTFREFVEAVKTGTSIPHISGGQLKSFSFVKPGINAAAVWSAFENVVAPLLAMADHTVGESIKLGALRDYLLPRLLSGQVRVRDFETQLERAV